MRIVIDTSAVIAVLLNEPERDELIARTDGVGLVAPRSLHAEIGNALVAMMRRRRITRDQAEQALTLYATMQLNFIEEGLTQSVRLADRYGLYAYDAYMMACALRLRLPLLSLDRRLNTAARAAGITVWEVSS